jgi:predicted RNA-binding Zn ribbon-like protein
MDMLQRVLGGAEQRSQYQDFVNRFDQGSPYDGISDEEAVSRYREVAPNLSRSDYRDSAEETFARLSLQERREFSQFLRSRASQRGVSVQDYDLNDDGIDDRAQDDPGELAEMTTQLRDRDPNILEQLMGRGGTGGPLDNPIAKVAFAGIAAMAAQRLMGGRR